MVPWMDDERLSVSYFVDEISTNLWYGRGVVERLQNLLTGLLPEHDRSAHHEQRHQSQGTE